MSTVRTFVGIPLPEQFSTALVDSCARIAEADPSWRGEKWVAKDNLHVTLRFIGNVAEDRIAELAHAIAGETGAMASEFALPLSGLKAVTSLRRARMLWATFLDPTGQCAALAAGIERASLPFGGEPDTRAFTPHVTLVRARTPHALSEDAFEAGEHALSQAPDVMSVAQVRLFSSTLKPDGPVYEVLRSYPLGRD